MAIKIITNLDAVQDNVELPFRVDLSQVLATYKGSETVTLEYWLDAEHDVFFEGGTKNQQTRQETISFVDTPINHRVNLVHGPGQAVDSVAIHQQLTDGSGTVQKNFDLARITIKSA